MGGHVKGTWRIPGLSGSHEQGSHEPGGAFVHQYRHSQAAARQDSPHENPAKTSIRHAWNSTHNRRIGSASPVEMLQHLTACPPETPPSLAISDSPTIINQWKGRTKHVYSGRTSPLGDITRRPSLALHATERHLGSDHPIFDPPGFRRIPSSQTTITGVLVLPPKLYYRSSIRRAPPLYK